MSEYLLPMVWIVLVFAACCWHEARKLRKP